ncbi:hypothetical protein P7C70_g5478, partial [Phenoliferia sp. Uapishka_3]
MSGLLSLSLLVLASIASAAGPAPVNLGTAANYVVIAEAGVSTVPQSAITGNLGASPTAQTYFTGFDNVESTDGTYSTSDQVTGRLYSASDASPTPSQLTTAVSDMQTAYNDASSRSNPDGLNIGGGTVAGVTFAPGLYNWGTNLDITGTIYCNGTAADTWIFQVAQDMTVASAKSLVLGGSALASNVVFVVAGSVTLGSGSEWNGVFLGATALHMNTGSSLTGRLYAQAAVTLQSSTLTEPTTGSTGTGIPLPILGRRQIHL